jgi:hypothetical protein
MMERGILDPESQLVPRAVLFRACRCASPDSVQRWFDVFRSAYGTLARFGEPSPVAEHESAVRASRSLEDDAVTLSHRFLHVREMLIDFLLSYPEDSRQVQGRVRPVTQHFTNLLANGQTPLPCNGFLRCERIRSSSEVVPPCVHQPGAALPTNGSFFPCRSSRPAPASRTMDHGGASDSPVPCETVGLTIPGLRFFVRSALHRFILTRRQLFGEDTLSDQFMQIFRFVISVPIFTIRHMA